MDMKLSKEEIDFAVVSYLALKGYKVEGDMTLRVSAKRGVEYLTLTNVKRQAYNEDKLIKRIKER